jgi:hypothetical protein
MKHARLAVILILGFSVSTVAQENETDALVRIYTPRSTSVPGKESVESSGFGAGFFVSEQGDLLTAYHVIQGAATVEIHVSSGKPCANPRIVGYDEHRDLAHLRCVPAPGSTVATLPIEDRFEPLPLEGGVIYGHPNATANQRFRADFPSARVLKSDKYFIGGGSSPFTGPPFDLITLNAVLEQGMSGGPVIYKGKVIGVVSGGQQPGGQQRGWAIPAGSYRTLRPVNSTDFKSLPPLTLLVGGQAPATFLKVAMPEDDLRVLIESAAVLRNANALLKRSRARLANVDDIDALRARMRGKKRLSDSDIEAIDAAVWSLDHDTPYPGRRRLDQELQAGRLPPANVFGAFLSILMSKIELHPAIGRERQEFDRSADTMRRKLDELGANDDGAAKARRALTDLETILQRWVTKAADETWIDEYHRAVAGITTRSKPTTKQSGGDAVTYLDDSLKLYRGAASLVAALVDLTDLELTVIEKLIGFNANPVIMELRIAG